MVLTTSLSVHSSNSSASNNHGNTYPSRDTALLGYSSRFCDRLSIQGTGSTEEIELTLSLLKNKPATTKEESISLSKTTTVTRNYEYWMFHLLPGSRIQVSACSQPGSRAVLFLVKSVRNFNKWEDDGYGHFEKRISIVDICPSSSSSKVANNILSYPVNYEEQYYIIIEDEHSSSTVDLSINITQVLYSVSPDLITANCSVLFNSRDSCSMPISYSSNYSKVLLQLNPRPGVPIDWEANNVVNVKCHPRAWLYAVICIFSALGGALLVIGVASTCVIYLKRDKIKQKLLGRTAPNLSQGTTATATVHGSHTEPSAPTEDNTPLIKSTPEREAPPPYNQDYNTLPPYKE